MDRPAGVGLAERGADLGGPPGGRLGALGVDGQGPVQGRAGVGAGFFTSALQNSLARRNVGAWGIFTRSGSTIATFSMALFVAGAHWQALG